MKIMGAELIAFMETGWPEPIDDWFWDHELFEKPDPEAEYETGEIGPIHYQGRGKDPTHGDGYDLARLIRAWRKRRDYDILQVVVSKDKTAHVKALLAAMPGVKVK